jgi:hypothetical protein
MTCGIGLIDTGALDFNCRQRSSYSYFASAICFRVDSSLARRACTINPEDLQFFVEQLAINFSAAEGWLRPLQFPRY